jgi:hypothetical protein
VRRRDTRTLPDGVVLVLSEPVFGEASMPRALLPGLEGSESLREPAWSRRERQGASERVQAATRRTQAMLLIVIGRSRVWAAL